MNLQEKRKFSAQELAEQNRRKEPPPKSSEGASTAKEPEKYSRAGCLLVCLLALILFAGIPACLILPEKWAWSSAEKADSINSYQAYLSRFPTGEHKDESVSRITELAEKEFLALPRPYSEQDVSKFKGKYYHYLSGEKISRFVAEDMLQKDDLDYYRNFSLMFPEGYPSETKINVRIKEKETALWESVKGSADKAFLNAMLKKLRTREITESVRARIAEIEEQEELRLWNEKYASSTDLAELEGFVSRKKFSSKAVRKLLSKRLDELYGDFLAVSRLNTKSAYEKFLSKNPNSEFAAKARERVVDFEVAEIAKGKHGDFSMSEPRKNFYSPSDEAKIELENQTGYTITVRYSGPKSLKEEIPPYGRRSVSVPPGRYKIAVTTVQPRVRPFYGENEIKAGEYRESFYISSYRF